MIYVLFAEGFEEVEALTVVDVLRRADIDTKTVSVKDDNNVTGSHNISILCDISIKDVDYDCIDAVIFPGGIPGTPNLKASDDVKKLTDYAYNNGKYIGAICAAPSVFADWGYLNGKRATANPYFMDKLPGAKALKKRVVCDGNIITSRAAGTACEFALEFVKVFKGKELANKLKKDMLYK